MCVCVCVCVCVSECVCVCVCELDQTNVGYKKVVMESCLKPKPVYMCRILLSILGHYIASSVHTCTSSFLNPVSLTFGSSMTVSSSIIARIFFFFRFTLFERLFCSCLCSADISVELWEGWGLLNILIT